MKSNCKRYRSLKSSNFVFIDLFSLHLPKTPKTTPPSTGTRTCGSARVPPSPRRRSRSGSRPGAPSGSRSTRSGATTTGRTGHTKSKTECTYGGYEIRYRWHHLPSNCYLFKPCLLNRVYCTWRDGKKIGSFQVRSSMVSSVNCSRYRVSRMSNRLNTERNVIS